MTSPFWSSTDWFAGPKIRTVGLSFREPETDKTVHLELYLPLSWRVNFNFNRTFQFTDTDK